MDGTAQCSPQDPLRDARTVNEKIANFRKDCLKNLLKILKESDRILEPDAAAELMRTFRLFTGLKQHALAEDLGVTQAMVSRWENNGSDTPCRIRKKLREAIIAGIERHL